MTDKYPYVGCCPHDLVDDYYRDFGDPFHVLFYAPSTGIVVQAPERLYEEGHRILDTCNLWDERKFRRVNCEYESELMLKFKSHIPRVKKKAKPTPPKQREYLINEDQLRAIRFCASRLVNDGCVALECEEVLVIDFVLDSLSQPKEVASD